MRKKNSLKRRNGKERRTPKEKAKKSGATAIGLKTTHRGNWQWSVDFTTAKAADAELLQSAASLATVVAAAVQAAVAGAQAAAPGPSLPARAPAFAQDATSRERILELELQLQELKQKHGM